MIHLACTVRAIHARDSGTRSGPARVLLVLSVSSGRILNRFCGCLASAVFTPSKLCLSFPRGCVFCFSVGCLVLFFVLFVSPGRIPNCPCGCLDNAVFTPSKLCFLFRRGLCLFFFFIVSRFFCLFVSSRRVPNRSGGCLDNAITLNTAVFTPVSFVYLVPTWFVFFLLCLCLLGFFVRRNRGKTQSEASKFPVAAGLASTAHGTDNMLEKLPVGTMAGILKVGVSS